MEDKTVVNISVSGGRTSAYMAWWMNENRQAVANHIGCQEPEMEYHFTFANTGMEHDDTLRFMNDVDQKLLGGQVVWLEGVVQHGERAATKHRVVTYETAFRNSQWRDLSHPFHATVTKYGVPNVSMKWCTREMKMTVINSYFSEAFGLRRQRKGCDVWTAIGIRGDENRRVSKNAGIEKLIYPLCDLNPVDKEDVLDWFSQYDWDLGIPEWQGNCVTCYKKSFKKLNKVWIETPEAFEFGRYIEKQYGRIGAEFDKYDTARPRKLFRGSRGTEDMIALFKENPADPGEYIDVMNDAGCSESCEMFPTEELTDTGADT